MYFIVGDTTYAYDVVGSGSPIVLLHGFTSSRSTWENFILEWKHAFKIITVDLQWHGDTKVNSPTDMEACCHDLAKLFTHLGLSSFHLVGYSMGGRTALSFTQFYPECILSLTLESASPGLKTVSEQMARKKQDERLAKKIEEHGIKWFVNDWENISLFHTQKKLPIQIQEKIRQERLSQSAQGLANSLRWMGTGTQPSWWGKLANITCPTLLIVGTLDEKFVKINKQMNRKIQNSHLQIVDQAGHAIHIEKPNEFNHAVGQFIFTHDV